MVWRINKFVFLPEQLGRELAPAPVQRNGWSGWRWVLASALMLARPPEGGKPAKAVAVERQDITDTTVRHYMVESDGMVVHTTKRKNVFRKMSDSVRAWKPSIAKLEWVKGPEGPRVPETIPVVNKAVAQEEHVFMCRVGGLSITRVRVDSNILTKVVADTVSALNMFRREDFVTLYPNPVERGGALHLAWLSEVGKYQLALLDMRGRLIEERLVEVGGMGQVDPWVLPVGLAAGVYVLRIVKDGSGRVDLREVAVR